MTTTQVKEELLILSANNYNLYKMMDSNLKEKSKFVLFHHVINHYPMKILIINNTKLIAIKQEEIESDLADILHDIAFVKMDQREVEDFINGVKGE